MVNNTFSIYYQCNTAIPIVIDIVNDRVNVIYWSIYLACCPDGLADLIDYCLLAVPYSNMVLLWQNRGEGAKKIML